VGEVRKWWVYSSEEPAEAWEGTEFIGPYTDDESKAVMALRPEFYRATKSQITTEFQGDPTADTFKWTKIRRGRQP
jgi:hypothetical protein